MKKTGYITGIKTSKNNQRQQFEQLLEGSFQLIRGKINEVIDFEQCKLDLQSLDKQTEEKHLRIPLFQL
jgi:hypothetical protein